MTTTVGDGIVEDAVGGILKTAAFAGSQLDGVTCYSSKSGLFRSVS